uniref:Cupin domain protein n=1 Tax=Pithovirus LCPAC202 TaxID=2506592 RepID=A0A481Z9A9_9VIRU|nr:MAG: cupin domain protein [Pithovirus LCPAC202]
MDTTDLVLDLNQSALRNEAYRHAIITTSKTQLVLMTLKLAEDIGKEIHQEDQFIYIVQGKGTAKLWLKTKNGKEIENTYNIYPGISITIPSGTWHNIINSGDIKMKLYTIYSPPEHDEDTYQETKPG